MRAAPPARLERTARRVCLVALLFLCLSVPAFGQVPRATTTFRGNPAVEGEILIRLRDVGAATFARVQSVLPAGEIEALIPSLGVHVVRAPGRTVQDLLDTFSANPDVLYAEPNYIVQAVATPNDPLYSQLYGMTKIGAPAAWDVTTGATSAVIGVIDTGVDYNHSDLAANIWSAPSSFTVNIGGMSITCPAGSHGFNAITKTCDPLDDHYHGTHVSGTIGGVGNNATGVAGVNWTARIMGLKFLSSSGSGSTADAVSAIQFAVQVKALFAGTATPVDVRILSNSWGGGGYSQTLLDAINLANSSAMLFVVAAGNSAADTEAFAFYPANYTAPNVISIAATDSVDALASFSNYGTATVHLGAPGVSTLSTAPNNSYQSLSGTSMATPHVAGAALLTLAACPSMSAADLKRALQNTTDPVASLNGKTISGGRLNVAKMVQGCRASSMSPASGRGSSQTFTFVASDKDGFGTVTSMVMLFNASLSFANACYIYFTPGSPGQLWLRRSDNNDPWIGPANVGPPGTLSNEQCIVDAGASSWSGSGSAVTLNLALSFLPAFAGAKTVSMHAADNVGDSGWQTVGGWTVPVAVGSAPSSLSVRPSTSSAAGTSRTFSYSVVDPDGGDDIASTVMLINSSLSFSNGCYMMFSPASRQIWLRDSANTSWLGPATIGVSTALSNSACTLYPGSSSSWTTGNTLTVNVFLTFAASFAGVKQNYLGATDFEGHATGLQQVGTYRVNAVPQPVSVTPSSGSGLSQTFSYVVSDGDGYTDVNWVDVLMWAGSYANTCYLSFYRPSNALYLVNDAGTQYLTPITIGTSATVSNSQCTVNAAGSSVSGSGSSLTMNLALTFRTTFAGIKTQYLNAEDTTGINSGFYSVGTWTVPAAPPPPTADSVTPASGIGSSQTFALQYSDPSGASNLTLTGVWFDVTTASTANSCLVYYARQTNTLYLSNDAGSAFLTAGLGTSTTLQNSQCALAVGSSSATPSGNTLTVNLAMTFKPPFGGAKNIYMYAVNATATSGGWQDRGDWLVATDVPVPADYDGDGKADFGLWHTATGIWDVLRSSDSVMVSRQWGAAYAPYNDVAVPGDYDGDGKTDFAVWRASTGTWYVLRSSDGATTSRQWGAAYAPFNDVPVPGDYDGDNKTDFAVWRTSTGTWYVLRSSDGTTMSRQWGAAYAPFNDLPVPGDYDGDGKTDFAVWRTSTGTWYVVRSSDGATMSRQWGAAYAPFNDLPVQGDYDGDGKTDFAVWRTTTGVWYILRSSDGAIVSRSWGAAASPYNDLPVQADYDGDGKTDIAVRRSSTGVWYVLRSSDGGIIVH